VSELFILSFHVFEVHIEPLSFANHSFVIVAFEAYNLCVFVS
jgi:hypothetical protein